MYCYDERACIASRCDRAFRMTSCMASCMMHGRCDVTPKEIFDIGLSRRTAEIRAGGTIDPANPPGPASSFCCAHLASHHGPADAEGPRHRRPCGPYHLRALYRGPSPLARLQPRPPGLSCYAGCWLVLHHQAIYLPILATGTHASAFRRVHTRALTSMLVCLCVRRPAIWRRLRWPRATSRTL